VARKPTRKHREHTRKPLSDARKQELFAQILAHAGAEVGRPSPVVEADEDDRVEMASDDMSDAPEAPRLGPALRFSRWLKGLRS
jgi:hypothetical protein